MYLLWVTVIIEVHFTFSEADYYVVSIYCVSIISWISHIYLFSIVNNISKCQWGNQIMVNLMVWNQWWMTSHASTETFGLCSRCRKQDGRDEWRSGSEAKHFYATYWFPPHIINHLWSQSLTQSLISSLAKVALIIMQISSSLFKCLRILVPQIWFVQIMLFFKSTAELLLVRMFF